VAEFNERLRALNRRDGYLRNVIGRIIRVPDPDYKDLPNRFIQSSAHDVLVCWVLEIYRLCGNRGLKLVPMLLDCHDSTSNECPSDRVDEVKAIYQEALDNINKELNLCVTIKMEMKTFQTLAGLKANEGV
jgi:DNA polymerase I-like protein with 3'-5' exonuclease and polymerase domains